MRKYMWALALCSAAGMAVPGWAQERSKSLFGLGRSARSAEKAEEKPSTKSSKLKNYGELFGKGDKGEIVSGDAPSPAAVERMMEETEQSRAASNGRTGRNSFDIPASTGAGSDTRATASRKVSLADEFDDSDTLDELEEQEELEEMVEEAADEAEQAAANAESVRTASRDSAKGEDSHSRVFVRPQAQSKADLPRMDFANDSTAAKESPEPAPAKKSGTPAWATDESEESVSPPAKDEVASKTPSVPERKGSLTVSRKPSGNTGVQPRPAPRPPVDEVAKVAQTRSHQSKLQTPIDTGSDATEEPVASAPPVKNSVTRSAAAPPSGASRLSISRTPKNATTTVSYDTTSEPPVRQLASAAATHAITSQSPTVNVEWRPTGAVTVGQESACELVVHNTGTVTAQRVEIEASFPANVRLLSSDPKPASTAALIWQFDEIAAGDQKVIQVKFIPVERGEVAASASVRFTGAAATSFAVTEPLLALKVDGPVEVMVGENASQTLVISNPGTGTAANVKVEAIIPAGLEHSRGDRLTMNIGNLAPGENRPIRLALTAVAGGRQVVEVHATADNGLVQSAANEVAVIAPSLVAGIEGPGLRYLNRQATYTLQVANDGAAATDNVRVMHKVPPGFDFVSADQGIQYDSQNRMLNWFVGRLARGESAQAKVVMNATQVGSHTHFIRATSDHGAISDSEITTRIEGAPSLVVDVSDLDDPVEVGVETAYEIVVKNEGTAPATNVSLSCELPSGVEFLSASGESSHVQESEQLVFQPVGQIAAGKSVTYRVKFKGTLSGNMRFRAKVTSDSLQEPLAAEEVTKVYSE